MEIKNKNGNKVLGTIISLVIVAVVAIFFLVANMKGISIKMDSNAVSISGGMIYSDKIDYSKINKVELRDNIDYGNRDNGMDMLNIDAGFFSNKEFGKYKLYVNTKSGKFIVLNYDNNKTAVFNDKDATSTEKIYNELNEKIKK